MLPKAQDPARVLGGSHLSLLHLGAGGETADGTKFAVSPELCGFRLASTTQNFHFGKIATFQLSSLLKFSNFRARGPQA